jgi:type II restriction enzyme
MPLLFKDECPQDGREYIQIFGNIGSKRMYKWFRKDLLKPVDNLYKYKVMIPKANGSGAIGETLSTPLIGTPLIGYSETYISIGATDVATEAQATLKYVKTKFARAMLGILKVTQTNPRSVWQFVPLQDFTSHSDVDWSQSIADIDKQLYTKYGLSQDEIDFIESHVKEME